MTQESLSLQSQRKTPSTDLVANSSNIGGQLERCIQRIPRTGKPRLATSVIDRWLLLDLSCSHSSCVSPKHEMGGKIGTSAYVAIG